MRANIDTFYFGFFCKEMREAGRQMEGKWSHRRFFFDVAYIMLEHMGMGVMVVCLKVSNTI